MSVLKNTHLWLGSYLRQALRRAAAGKVPTRPVHILFCCVDHFEPEWHGAEAALQDQRVADWVSGYPVLSRRHQDSDGRHPRHSFFYPAEVYEARHLDQLAGLCCQGFGEVEVHLHHDQDTADTLRVKLEKAKTDFQRHGLLGHKAGDGSTAYGFIHGNWALNNSRPDGRWCGVNNETRVLLETGCYADFTFPSAPSPTQPHQINSLYYDTGLAEGPKSHDHGELVRAGQEGKGLMLITGPLALNWWRRKWGVLPKIENSDLTGKNPPTPERADLWIRQAIGVMGRPEWIFIKVHTHGAQDNNRPVLLGAPMEELFSYLEGLSRHGGNIFLHYVTAREMYNIAKAAEAGRQGNPADYRDGTILPPEAARKGES